MSNRVPILVSVDPEQASAVGNALQALGFQTTELLPDIGTITGSCPDDQLDAIRRVPGVLGVERARGVALPPPDSPIQ
ncbi:MAG: hypothetical protein ABW061_09440 [Polyangiaceae bacterium]